MKGETMETQLIDMLESLKTTKPEYGCIGVFKTEKPFNFIWVVLVSRDVRNDQDRFVVWDWNADDGSFFHGTYCRSRETAVAEFMRRCRMASRPPTLTSSRDEEFGMLKTLWTFYAGTMEEQDRKPSLVGFVADLVGSILKGCWSWLRK